MMTYINTMMEIQDDELITSWLEVLGANNDFTVLDFLNDFKINYDKNALLIHKDYLRNISYFYKEYGDRGFPNILNIMKKHTGYFACLTLREKSLNVLISESMLRNYSRESSEQRIFSDKNIKDDIKRYMMKYMVCPLCMKEDIKKCYRPYVHVWHNLPGVICCHKHECKLVELDSENAEVIGATEEEIRIARFMYQLYLNPCYGCLEQVLVILKEQDPDTVIIEKSAISEIVAAITKLFSYDEFTKRLKQINDFVDTTNLMIERVCKVCGNNYYISIDAEKIGFDCPECDKNREFYHIFKRFLDCSGNNDFEILDISKYKKVTLIHKSCGRHINRHLVQIIKNGISCPKCMVSHQGESALATNGQTMSIIRYNGNTDIDVQFEDGTIVVNKAYCSFLKGNITNPNCKSNIIKDRTGEMSVATNGQIMSIIRYEKHNDIDIEFEDGTIVKNKRYEKFLNGNIKNPNQKSYKFIDRIGETSIATNGQIMTIIRYNGSADIDVQFEDGTIVKNKTYFMFLKGLIRNPNCKTSREKFKIGETSVASNGQLMTIIRYKKHIDIDVQFEDGTIVKNKSYRNFLDGHIANPNYELMKKEKRIGETKIASNGQCMTIIRYKTHSNIDVQFEDGTIVKNKSYGSFLNGEIANPNYELMKKEKRIGETRIATNGQQMTIIRYNSYANIDVQFEDGTVVKKKTYGSFQNGNIRNPNCKIKIKRKES